MFKSQNKQSLAQQLKNKFISTPTKRDGGKSKQNERKMPKIPTSEEESLMQQSLKEKMTPTNNEFIKSYGPFFLEHSIAAEYNHLKKTRLPGVYCIPSYSDPLVWFGVIFIRQGMYQDGVFRFTMNIPNNYPDGDCPKLYFTPAVFHPFINPSNGMLDLDRAFSTWRPNVNHIWQILLYVRRIFYKFDTKDPINCQAAELHQTDKESYKRKVQADIAEINNKIYEDNDDDPHAFRFREWKEDIHEPIRQQIIADSEKTFPIEEDFERPKLSGLSYVEPGTTLIFSKQS